MKVASLQDLFVEELRDLYDAEKQLVRALPKMAKSSTDSELGAGFREHLEQTRRQVERLEKVFGLLETKARSKPCKGMKGLVEEGQEVIEEEREEGLTDPAIVGASRRVEHYEMAGYENARALAQALGLREASQLLEETLREEMDMDRRLSQISRRLVKEVARGAVSARETAGSRGGGRASASTRAKPAARSSRSTGSRGAGGQESTGRGSHVTTDHDEIRDWAEERGALPACVRGTGGRGDTGMIQLDFPGYGGEESLDHITWDEWFAKFDESKLALLLQETTAGGEKSNFNKLISRTSGSGNKPRTKTAR